MIMRTILIQITCLIISIEQGWLQARFHSITFLPKGSICQMSPNIHSLSFFSIRTSMKQAQDCAKPLTLPCRYKQS